VRRSSSRSALVGALTAALLLAGTPAQAAPAAPALSARAGHQLVQLSWAGGGSAGVLIRALEGTTPPTSTAEGRAVTPASAVATSVTDTGLVDGTPQSYALWAVDSDGSVSDAPTTVTATPRPPAPTTLRLRPSTSVVAAGRTLTITGRLYETATGRPLAGQRVAVYARTGGTTATRLLATVTTRPDGLLHHAVVPRTSAEYQLRYAGDAFDAAAASERVVVRVLPRVALRLSPGALLAGQTSTVTGAVVPAYQGARVVLQRRTGSGWAALRTLATSADGRFTTTVTPSSTTVLRAVLAGTYAYDTAQSPELELRVDPRDLRIGMRGPDVLAVERALWQQGKADVGRVDGVFDADTLHGVIAFQKSQGLPRTGVFSGPTRTRLASHVQRPARYAATGRSVEIDLSQQVLRMFEGGRLVRLADVSTGNGEPYTSQGVDYVADTPTGRFSVTRKIDGIRVSHLGELYRPAYFVGGFAVHGSRSVPTYPASHGCVRVTFSQMDRLFPLLTVGTPLAVYSR
jgi:peptidoglycan hydrolase-like protein with peptidoglycan-binding domain